MLSTTQAARAAAVRILGAGAEMRFRFAQSDVPSAFHVEQRGDVIEIAGDSAVSMLCGLNHYCRQALNLQLSWQRPTADLPETAPALDGPIRMRSPYQVRYYLNYCTYSYSMAFWDWDRWERELDLMALGGVNMALSLVGQESVLREALLELGMTGEQISRYIAGPAHLAWFFLGNMTGFGGDLPDQWFDDRLALAHRIHERMLELGIAPVFPGFYGIVPKELGALYPDSEILPQGEWCGFQRPGFVQHTNPLFGAVADAYYRAQRRLMGDIARHFTAEPFHEGGDASGVDLPGYGEAILGAMRRGRTDAVWVLQAWDANPSMALFDRLQRDDVLILNLLAGRNARFHEIANDFGGHPWVWCPVHIYGGRNPMYGFLDLMAHEPLGLVQGGRSAICGIGVAPEAIETNPVFYELFWDITYRDAAPEMDGWLDGYIRRRYGALTENARSAWRLLERSAYSGFVLQPQFEESFLCARPDFTVQSVSLWGAKNLNYDMRPVAQSVRLLLRDYELLGENEGYRYDLIYAAKQVLANASRAQYAHLMYLLSQKQYDAFFAAADEFLQLGKATDALLSAQQGFTIAPWLRSARACGARYGMAEHFVRMAKTQVTVWGSKEASQYLRDYASKEWGGMIGSFYLMRWRVFFSEIRRWLDSGRALDITASVSRDWADGSEGEAKREAFTIDWYEIERDWIENTQLDEHPAPTELRGAIERALRYMP